MSGENEADGRIDKIEEILGNVVRVTSPANTKIEIYDFMILGKLGDDNSGGIALILIKLKTEEDAKLIMKRKRYLKEIKEVN